MASKGEGLLDAAFLGQTSSFAGRTIKRRQVAKYSYYIEMMLNLGIGLPEAFFWLPEVSVMQILRRRHLGFEGIT